MGILLALVTMAVALVFFITRLCEGKAPSGGFGELTFGLGWLVACVVVAAILWKNFGDSGAPEPWVLGTLAVGFVLTIALGGRNNGR